jgi:hypothetical protein
MNLPNVVNFCHVLCKIINRNKKEKSRRQFLIEISFATRGLVLLPAFACTTGALPGENMKLGLVTYNWGKDWDISTIVKNCTESGIPGVELWVGHKRRI